ncbi:unnamed protein product, partial [Choristocarpus tenellus]
KSGRNTVRCLQSYPVLQSPRRFTTTSFDRLYLVSFQCTGAVHLHRPPLQPTVWSDDHW